MNTAFNIRKLQDVDGLRKGKKRGRRNKSRSKYVSKAFDYSKYDFTNKAVHLKKQFFTLFRHDFGINYFPPEEVFTIYSDEDDSSKEKKDSKKVAIEKGKISLNADIDPNELRKQRILSRTKVHTQKVARTLEEKLYIQHLKKIIRIFQGEELSDESVIWCPSVLPLRISYRTVVEKKLRKHRKEIVRLQKKPFSKAGQGFTKIRNLVNRLICKPYHRDLVMQKISILKMKNHKINELDPDFFKVTPKLKELNLSFNSIEKIPIFEPVSKNLRVFNAVGNKIREIRSFFRRSSTTNFCWKNLIHLGLGWNELRSIRFLKDGRKTLPNLVSLDLSYNRFGLSTTTTTSDEEKEEELEGGLDTCLSSDAGDNTMKRRKKSYEKSFEQFMSMLEKNFDLEILILKGNIFCLCNYYKEDYVVSKFPQGCLRVFDDTEIVRKEEDEDKDLFDEFEEEQNDFFGGVDPSMLSEEEDEEEEEEEEEGEEEEEEEKKKSSSRSRKSKRKDGKKGRLGSPGKGRKRKSGIHRSMSSTTELYSSDDEPPANEIEKKLKERKRFLRNIPQRDYVSLDLRITRFGGVPVKGSILYNKEKKDFEYMDETLNVQGKGKGGKGRKTVRKGGGKGSRGGRTGRRGGRGSGGKRSGRTGKKSSSRRPSKIIKEEEEEEKEDEKKKKKKKLFYCQYFLSYEFLGEECVSDYFFETRDSSTRTHLLRFNRRFEFDHPTVELCDRLREPMIVHLKRRKIEYLEDCEAEDGPTQLSKMEERILEVEEVGRCFLELERFLEGGLKEIKFGGTFAQELKSPEEKEKPEEEKGSKEGEKKGKKRTGKGGVAESKARKRKKKKEEEAETKKGRKKKIEKGGGLMISTAADEKKKVKGKENDGDGGEKQVKVYDVSETDFDSVLENVGIQGRCMLRYSSVAEEKEVKTLVEMVNQEREKREEQEAGKKKKGRKSGRKGGKKK